MISKKDLIAYRGYHPEDKNFIFSTWLPAIYHGNPWFKELDEKKYYEMYPSVIDSILKRPDSFVSVACLTEDPYVILGYSVYEKSILHFVFVKSAWRNIGIGSSLIPEQIKKYTHSTAAGASVMEKKFPHTKFNPYLTYFPINEEPHGRNKNRKNH